MFAALFRNPKGMIAAAAVSALSAQGPQAAPNVIQTITGYDVTYPKGKIGGSSAVGLPAQYVGIPPGKEYYLDYQVKFHEDFEWVKGGKLPGLVGGSHTSGCNGIVPGGWSARFMWHGGGTIDLYLYHQNRRSGCGDTYYPTDKAKYPKNQWVRITQRVVLNSPGVNDGIIEVWYDGQKGISMEKVQLRGKVSEATAMIDAVSLQTFYGGSSTSWAPPRDTHATFSRFYVLDGPPDFTKPFEDRALGIRPGAARNPAASARTGYLDGDRGGTFLFESGSSDPGESQAFDASGRLRLPLGSSTSR